MSFDVYKIYDVPLENLYDEDTYEMLQKGKNLGVFQLESPLLKHWTKKLRPESLDDLAVLVAAVRPGVLNATHADGRTMAQVICDRRNGVEDIKYDHPLLERALRNTYGVLLYQESLMMIGEDVAGWTKLQGLALQKAIAKKKADEVARLKIVFVEDAVKFGRVDRETATKIYESMEASARYLFNACFSKNTKLKLSSDGGKSKYRWTLEEAFKIRNDINYAKQTGHLSLYKKWKMLGNYGKGWSLCEDGRIRPNIIKDIKYAGFKEVFELTLDNGFSIRATDNHKFPTPDGMKTLGELRVGETLYVKGPYEKTANNYCFSGVTREEIAARSKGSVYRAFGEKNFYYTNGSYKDFVTNGQLLPPQCNMCGVIKNRMEVDHIDGNRYDSSIINLQRLCVSCHKKKEYAAGRTRRGEKGYPTEESEIVSIVSVGFDDVYDVEMDAPNHTLLVEDGILACNSHSYEYGLIAYLTAYWKAHFPLDTFVARLQRSNSAVKPQEEVEILVRECLSEDIEVKLPSILIHREKFDTVEDYIIFGWTNIKGLGQKHAETVALAIKDFDIANMSWTRFLISFAHKIKDAPKISPSVLKSFIEVGALDHFKTDRRRMLFELENYGNLSDGECKWMRNNYNGESLIDILIKGARRKKDGGACQNDASVTKMTSVIDQLQKPPFDLRDTIDWIIIREKDLLGISLTYTKLDKFNVDLANLTLKQFSETSQCPTPSILVAEVTRIKPLVTKNGKNPGQDMAQLSLRDNTMTFSEVVIFPKEWELYGEHFVLGAVLVLEAEPTRDKKGLVIKKASKLKRII